MSLFFSIFYNFFPLTTNPYAAALARTERSVLPQRPNIVSLFDGSKRRIPDFLRKYSGASAAELTKSPFGTTVYPQAGSAHSLFCRTDYWKFNE